MKVHDVVRIKAGRLRGLWGVVESVAVGGARVTVRVEGVRDGAGFVEVVEMNVDKVEVR